MAEKDAGASVRFHVEVVTPYELFFEGDAEMVIVTGVDGELGVLAGRTPVVVALAPGEIRMLIDGKWRIAAASNGYAEIDRTRMTILANSAEWPEDIDVGRVQRAIDRASARIADPKTSPQEVERSRLGIQRAKARLHVASEHAPSDEGRPKDHSTLK